MTRRRDTALTREEICATALRIIDAEGLDALSMRRLARELDIEAMSLYHHFPNKDAILDAVATSVVLSMSLPEPLPEHWVDQLVEMVDAFRAALALHPNAMPVVLTRPLAPPEEAMATPATVLAGQGLDPERMLAMYQALMALTFGHAVVSSVAARGEVAEGATPPLLDEDAFRRAARYLIEGFASEQSTRGREGSD